MGDYPDLSAIKYQALNAIPDVLREKQREFRLTEKKAKRRQRQRGE